MGAVVSHPVPANPRTDSPCDEAALVRAARRHGVRIEGSAWHWADPGAAPPALVLGYGTADEAAIEGGIAAIAAAYASL